MVRRISVDSGQELVIQNNSDDIIMLGTLEDEDHLGDNGILIPKNSVFRQKSNINRFFYVRFNEGQDFRYGVF